MDIIFLALIPTSPVPFCKQGLFLCDLTRCIPILWRCDGYYDCMDFSDETGCSTTTKQPTTSLTKTTTRLTTTSPEGFTLLEILTLPMEQHATCSSYVVKI